MALSTVIQRVGWAEHTCEAQQFYSTMLGFAAPTYGLLKKIRVLTIICSVCLRRRYT